MFSTDWTRFLKLSWVTRLGEDLQGYVRVPSFSLPSLKGRWICMYVRHGGVFDAPDGFRVLVRQVAPDG